MGLFEAWTVPRRVLRSYPLLVFFTNKITVSRFGLYVKEKS